MILLAATESVTSNVALTQLLDPMHLLTETWLKNAVLPAILVIVFGPCFSKKACVWVT